MLPLYRVLYADDKENSGKASWNIVKRIMEWDVLINSGIICAEPYTGNSFFDSKLNSNDLVDIVNKIDFLIIDLNWGSNNLSHRGFEICKEIRGLSKNNEVPVYNMIYSAENPLALQYGYEANPSIIDSYKNLQAPYNLWYIKDDTHKTDDKIATDDQIRDGVRWHYGLKIRSLLRSKVNRQSIQEFFDLISSTSCSTLDQLEKFPIILTDETEIMAGLLFGHILKGFPVSSKRPFQIIKEEIKEEIIKSINETNDRREILLLLLKKKPFVNLFHAKDSGNAFTIAQYKEWLSGMKDMLDPLISSANQRNVCGNPFEQENEVLKRSADTITQLLEIYEETKFFSIMRNNLGRKQSIRFVHSQNWSQIDQSAEVGDEKWETTKRNVNLFDIPFKHLFRVCYDEFFHNNQTQIKLGNDSDGRLSILVFRPFFEDVVKFWTSINKPTLYTGTNPDYSSIVFALIYNEGGVPNILTGGETRRSIIPISYYAEILAEDQNHCYGYFKGEPNAELNATFWKGISGIPSLNGKQWRISFKFLGL